MAYVSRTPLEKVAEAISELTYRDMCELAFQIAERLDTGGPWNIPDDYQRPEAESRLADQLSEWAVKRNEDYANRAEAQK